MCRSACSVVRSGLATPPRSEFLQNLLGWRRATLVGLSKTARDRGVQRLSFLVIKLVAFIVDDEIQHRPLGEVSRLINDQSTIADCGADTHVKRIAQ